jgi:hypothetical protein
MSLSTWFGFKTGGDLNNDELPDIYPLEMKERDFVDTDIVTIYQKILTDVVERTNGLSDEQATLLWDNCLKSSSSEGLVTRIAKAMSDKRDLFLVYESAVNIVRDATSNEQQQIKADYEKFASSSKGVYISFKNYSRSDMIRLYGGLEYATTGALNKSMNLSSALQFKMNDLRGTTALSDAAEVKSQAQAIAKGLKEGKDVLLDSKDIIESSRPDLTAVKEAITFLDSKRSFYLGLPEAYITGIQTGGLGTTGENDTRAIERGLKSYYYSIIKPVLETLFGVKLKYKSQDFRQIGQALETIKTFELVSDELVSLESKKRIVESLLDLDADENETKPGTSVPPRDVGPRAIPPTPVKRGEA